MTPRVLVTRAIPEAGLEIVRRECDALVLPGDEPPSPEALREAVRGREGLICLLTDVIDAKVLDAAGPRLRVLSNFAVGVNNIDMAEATRRRIPVGYTPGVLTEATADLTFSLLLAAARRIVEGADMARASAWTCWGPRLLLGRDVHGATLGLVGFGRIGQAVARRALGFGMRVIWFDPAHQGASPLEGPERRMRLDEILAESDFVSLHAPLTDATRRLIDAEALRKMKPTAVLVNTARGAIVDTEALADALERGVIWAAALDVTDPEPLPPGHRLLGLPNCVVVPHLGSATHATRDRMAVMAAENLLAGLRGERLPHCANPEIYG